MRSEHHPFGVVWDFLDEEQWSMIASLIEAGGEGPCCSEDLLFSIEADPSRAAILQEWYYDALGCNTKTDRDESDYRKDRYIDKILELV